MIPYHKLNRNINIKTSFVSLKSKKQIVGIVEEEQDLGLLIDTITSTYPVPVNPFGDTGFDLSVSNSIVGRTAFQNSVRDLRLNICMYPSGAVGNWHYFAMSGGDGWNSKSTDAVLRGLNYQTVQGGDLYNGGLPYGRDFFEEWIDLCVKSGITRCGLGLNIASPLCPFSNGGAVKVINWATIDIGSVISQINIAVAKMAAAGLPIVIWEAGMEFTIGAWADLVDKTIEPVLVPGDPQEGGAVIAKLMTHTNGTSAVSILNHIKSVTPNALISIDAKLWDNVTNNYPNWNSQVSLIDPAILIRQYYQFDTNHLQSYATGRARIADYTTFFNFITHASFNNKKTFISQIAFKTASNPVKATFANGLLLCEAYMVLIRESALRNNILVGIIHMNLLSLINVNNNYTNKILYYFEKLIGEFLAPSFTIISCSFVDNDLETNLVKFAIKTEEDTRVAILNPTINDYYMEEGIGVDAVGKSFESTQIYSTTLNILDTNYTILPEENVFHIRPYSFSKIIIRN